MCRHAFSDFLQITVDFWALYFQFRASRVMICHIFVHAFPTAITITALHGQCSSICSRETLLCTNWPSKQTRHVGHLRRVPLTLTSASMQSLHPEWPQLKLTGFNIVKKLLQDIKFCYASEVNEFALHKRSLQEKVTKRNSPNTTT